MSLGRARHVPVREVTDGDSRSFTEQPGWLLTCGAAGPPVATTTFPLEARGDLEGPGVPVESRPAHAEHLTAGAQVRGRGQPRSRTR
jgi:hypothetical protein